MDKRIITIGRQYGSGGREIGKKLAATLGIAYYDIVLITQAAQKSGICENIAEKYDEAPMNSLLYSIYAMTSGKENMADHMPIHTRVAFAQFEAIKEIAEKESAVIVGRCADFILKDRLDVFNVFIMSDLKKRIERVAHRNAISMEDAEKRILKKDKQRASYYNYHTDQKWGMASNYHCCLDSGFYGMDGTVKILQEVIEAVEDR